MRRVVAIEPGAGRPGAVLTLDHDLRSRRRAVFRPDDADPILLDMARPVHLRGGDGLVLDDGSRVRIEAAPEALIEITAPDLPALVRIAWHLGNRHLPTQLCGDRLLIRHDHVIADMVVGLGGTVRLVDAPFDPEGGAYRQTGDGHHHHHDHHDGHDHGHDH